MHMNDSIYDILEQEKLNYSDKRPKVMGGGEDQLTGKEHKRTF